ncbi:MAG TPA: BON domain-containing protein [Candidatus Angelobacter sp.]|jgi:osmotically-inducible protein OsmY|nr:BON domain-containing protein [Candidatus Angelobacter sp.]
MTRRASYGLALILCFGVSLCAWPQSAKNNQSSAADQRMQDRISREVYHELVMLPQLTIFDNLSYKIDGGAVTLMGEVRNAVLKDEAQQAVKKIEGVETVNNQIEILPPSPNDDRIRRAVARSLFNDDRLFRYSMGSVPPIHIIVKSGHVTLEGVVDNQADKNEAGLRANSVPGVFSVQNNLRVGG